MQVQFIGAQSTESIALSGFQFDKLKKYAQNFVHEEKICNFLNSKNYGVNAFKNNGYDLLVSSFLSLDPTHLTQFIKYIESNDTLLYYNTKGNIVRKCVDVGLSEIFALKLLNTTAVDQKGNFIGPGEILFSLFFNDLKNGIDDSDLLYNDVKIEVKCRGGRFGERPSKSTYTPFSCFADNILTESETLMYKSNCDGLKDLCAHLKYGYSLCADKEIYYNYICDLLDKVYGRGNNISKTFLTITDFESFTLKNNIAKIYIYGKILSKGVAHVLFINENNDYLFTERYSILENGGLIDMGVLSIGEFKFNDLYPKVSLNTIDAIVQ